MVPDCSWLGTMPSLAPKVKLCASQSATKPFRTGKTFAATGVFWDLTVGFDGWCATVLASVVGVRRTSAVPHETSNNETMRLTKSRIRELEAVSLRTRAVETWVDLGKGGQKAEKRCGFSHLKTAATRLFPHNST